MRAGIADKVNPRGFIADYVAYAAELTDAPVEFHLGAGLTVLATACGSRVLYPGYGGRTCWPNLYTLLIAPSGLFRKSTAVLLAEELLSEVSADLILTGEQSREKFVALLREHPTMLYPISEFSAVLSIWNRDYAAGFREMITDLFDNRKEYHRQTLKGGKVTIVRPAINILAASTIEWLREKLTEGDLRGGLMGRFICFPAIYKPADRGLNPEPNPALKQKLRQFLSSLLQVEKAWVDVRPVLPDYNRWVSEMERTMQRHPNPDAIGFLSRLGAHCLKLAVLLEISESGPLDKYELTSGSLSRAMTLSYWLFEKAAELAETGFVKSKLEHQIQRFLEMARRNGGVERREAVRLLHVSSREFDSILLPTALAREQIQATTVPTATKNKIVYQFKETGQDTPFAQEDCEHL